MVKSRTITEQFGTGCTIRRADGGIQNWRHPELAASGIGGIQSWRHPDPPPLLTFDLAAAPPLPESLSQESSRLRGI